MPTDTAEPAAPPTHTHRFFTWMRSLGIPRHPGWIGGVCAGIAERLGIDPLIVRGIAVVVAVLGGPAILLYAAAWLILPDRFDHIHLEQLIHGKVEPVIAAIGALFILSLLPVTQGFWSAGAAFWNGGASVGRIIWTIVLLAAIVGVIVGVARRNAPPAEPGAPGETADVAASAAPATPTVPLPTAPPRPGADATTEDFAAWREQQAAWRAERAVFQAQEQATIRETNLARARERREAAAARNLEYLERQARWRKANPRLPGGIVATAIGAAIILGAIAELVASTVPDWHGVELAAGFGTATIGLGLVIVVAAAFGRRNGFMVFLSVVTLVATLLAAVPNGRQLVWADYQTSGTGNITQLAGRLQLDALPGTTGTLDVWQGAGDVVVNVEKGATVRLTETRNGHLVRAQTFGMASVPDETITIWQGAGHVQVNDDNEAGTK